MNDNSAVKGAADMKTKCDKETPKKVGPARGGGQDKGRLNWREKKK